MSRDKWRSAPRVEGQIPQVEAQVNTGAEGGGKRDLSDGGKGGGRTQYRKWEAVTPCTPPPPHPRLPTGGKVLMQKVIILYTLSSRKEKRQTLMSTELFRFTGPYEKYQLQSYGMKTTSLANKKTLIDISEPAISHKYWSEDSLV